jgi:hypothetical protein
VHVDQNSHLSIAVSELDRILLDVLRLALSHSNVRRVDVYSSRRPQEECIRVAAESEPRSVDDELAALRRHSDVFRGFFVPDPSTRLGRFAARLRKLDTSTVYPLLLLLAVEGATLPAPEFNAILIDLESYLIQRAVCGLSIKQYNRFFLQLLQSFCKAGAVNHQNVRNYLLAAQGSSTLWPTDKDFERKWLREPAYANLGPAATGMILEAIDHQLRTSKCETISIQGALTVEHVLPQEWTDHWPLDANAALEPTADEDSQDFQLAVSPVGASRPSWAQCSLVGDAVGSIIAFTPWIRG